MEISISQAMQTFEELLGRVRAGERITITKDGVPVADLVQHAEPENGTGPSRRGSLVERMREIRARQKIETTIEEILQMRDEGRR